MSSADCLTPGATSSRARQELFSPVFETVQTPKLDIFIILDIKFRDKTLHVLYKHSVLGSSSLKSVNLDHLNRERVADYL